MQKQSMRIIFCKTAFLILALFVLSSCGLTGIFMPGDQITAEEHINLGIAYERNKQLDEALREYMIAAKQLPIAYLYMGNIYFQKDAVDEAERCYKKAINTTKDPRAYNNLAWLYYSEDMKLDEAEKLAGKAVELSPDAQDYKDTLEKVVEKRLEIQRRGI
jgi:tetratricopeptide (TPR) repeat protein